VNKMIVIVDDDMDMATSCARVLKSQGYDTMALENPLELLQILPENPDIDLIITDVVMPQMDGLELLKQIHIINPNLDVIIMTGYGSIPNAIKAIQEGAKNYIPKPFEKDELVGKVKDVLLRKEKETIKKDELSENPDLGYDLVGNSRHILEIHTLIEAAANTDAEVLILGESGTGKEVVARRIHHFSKRNSNPFIAINCGSLPHELVESELFGHRKGAFTGADQDQKGLFELANKGVVFLDEIGEMPSSAQVKLLRVIQEKKVRPLGSENEINVDVRILTATNRNLEEHVSKEKFRKDLFYRLNVLTIKLLPLREHSEDIELLTHYFIKKFNKKYNREVDALELEALKQLEFYPWPGNVRELENTIERIFVLNAELTTVSAKHLPEVLRKQQSVLANGEKKVLVSLSETEQKAVENALRACDFNKSKAAQLLGISRSRLYKKIKIYNIQN